MVVNDEKRSLYQNLKGEAFVIPPGQSFGSGTFFNKEITSKKRFLSDILNLTIFSPKETVTL